MAITIMLQLMSDLKKRKLSHRGARQKGKRLEHDVTKALKNIGIDAQRTPLSGALSWMPGDVTELNTVKVHVHECKNCETLSIPDWWRQAVRQAVNNEVPVLHFTSNYQGIYTVLRSLDFDDLVFSYEKYRPELVLSLMEFPKRKNFWKFIEHRKKEEVFTYQSLEGEELVILPLEMYLRLRRYDLKRRADEVLTASVGA